jgi:hypothetical protein
MKPLAGDAPDPGSDEPTEDELRAMLAVREDRQRAERRRLSRRLSRALLGMTVIATAAVTAIPATRGWIAGLGQPAPAVDRPPPPPPLPPPLLRRAADNGALLREARMSPSADPQGKGGDGGIIDQGDMRFAMDLLQFLQGPPPAKDP